MSARRTDRREHPYRVGTRPRQSPANIMILTVVAVLGVTAVAAAVMGGGFDDVTPHGQVLGDLQLVAEAQKRHYQETGSFAAWMQSLDVTPNPDVHLSLLRGGGSDWEAVAYHPVGLSCTQGGRVVGGVVRIDPPSCHTTHP